MYSDLVIVTFSSFFLLHHESPVKSIVSTILVLFYTMAFAFTSCCFIFCVRRGLPNKYSISSDVSIMVCSSPAKDHLKCPFSSRLKCSKKPSPSHSRIFNRSRFLLQNTNNAIPNRSSLKIPSTIAASPFIDLRMSVYHSKVYSSVSYVQHSFNALHRRINAVSLKLQVQ